MKFVDCTLDRHAVANLADLQSAGQQGATMVALIEQPPRHP
jgi:hypothetical protein